MQGMYSGDTHFSRKDRQPLAPKPPGWYKRNEENREWRKACGRNQPVRRESENRKLNP
jgi:hypothetical protein